MTGKDFDTLNEAYRTKVSEVAPAVAVVGRAVAGAAAKHADKKAGQAISKRLKKDDEEETNEAQDIQVTNPGGGGKTQELSGSTRDVRATPKRKRKSKKKKSTAKEAAKPDYLDADGDGDKKEPMKKAFKDKKKKKPINAAHCNEKATDQRPKDEVKSDDIEEGGCDQVHDELQEPIEGSEKEEKKSKKTAKESINNSNKGNIMSENKTTFDKLYESVMSEDEDFELGLPTEDETDGIDELELGDDEGGDVTVTLSPAHVDCLKEILDQVGGGEDEGEEDEFGDEPDPLEAGAHESSEVTEEDTTHTKDGSKPGVDPSDGGGKSTEPAADSLGGKSSGTGDTPVTDEIDGGTDTGEGKKVGHTKAKGVGKAKLAV